MALQAALTVIGNATMCFAAFRICKLSNVTRSYEVSTPIIHCMCVKKIVHCYVLSFYWRSKLGWVLLTKIDIFVYLLQKGLGRLKTKPDCHTLYYLNVSHFSLMLVWEWLEALKQPESQMLSCFWAVYIIITSPLLCLVSLSTDWFDLSLSCWS